MSLFLAAVASVAATPVPTVVPSPTPIVQVVQQIKEVAVTPEYINQLVLVGLLGLAGFLGSWIQAFINSHKKLGEKVNILLTAFYTIAGSAVVLFQQGQLDLKDLTPAKAVSAAAVVLLAAWVRHNGSKLTAPSTTALNASSEAVGVGVDPNIIPRKAAV